MKQRFKWISVRFIIAFSFIGIGWIILDHFLANKLISAIKPTTLPHLISDVVFLIATGLSVFTLLHIWERKRYKSEEYLLENETKLREIFEKAPIAYHSLDADANLLLINKTWLEMLGYSADEVLGKWFGSFLTKDSRDTLSTNFPKLKKSEEIKDIELQMVKKDGSLIYINLSGRISTDLEGNFKQTHCVLRDVTKEVQYSHALKESEGKYRSVINNTMEGIFVIQNRKLVFCNQRFCEILGIKNIEDALETNFNQFIHKDDKSSFEKYLVEREAGKKQTELYHFDAIRSDKTEIQLESLSHLILFNNRPAIQGTIRDVTEQENLRLQLTQSQKMEAIGRLASGVAHDFNNLLTAIIGSAELAKLNMGNNVFDNESMDEILATSKKGAELTRQLLAFSRKDITNPVPLNLNETINNLDVLFMRLITETVSLSFDLEPNLWTIKADNSQIEQILINLVINAKDAMPEGGKLTIKTENVTIENQYCLICLSTFSGNYAKVTVTDSGIGITEEEISIIFEPFYTTKAKHKGTGLGLSTVYGVVKNLGGHISVNSQPGKGSHFQILFPIISETAEHQAYRTVDSFVPSEVKAGTETLLVIEDEIEVRKTTVRSLKQFGYTVFEAESGVKGLDIVASLGEMIDLVLSDIVMPEMDGVTFVEEVKKIRPDMKAVFMSGYAPSALPSINTNINKLPENIPLLKKPFHPKDLAQTIRAALDMKTQV